MAKRKAALDSTEVTKERILRVAADLFMRHGYDGTSVREIGDKAGIGQSSLYHHMQSKAHLLKALHEQFIEEMLERMKEVSTGDDSPSDKLRRLIAVVLATIEMHQAEVTVFLREQHALPAEMRAAVVQQRDVVDRIVDGVIRDGIAKGEFRDDLDVRLMRLAVLGMCNWAYQWFRKNDKLSGSDIAAAFGDIAVAGIRARPTSPRANGRQAADERPTGQRAARPRAKKGTTRQ